MTREDIRSTLEMSRDITDWLAETLTRPPEDSSITCVPDGYYVYSWPEFHELCAKLGVAIVHDGATVIELTCESEERIGQWRSREWIAFAKRAGIRMDAYTTRVRIVIAEGTFPQVEHHYAMSSRTMLSQEKDLPRRCFNESRKGETSE